MKSRLFIGSSRESINIAYAAQQNLHHTAEVTVWDQGVFQLSVTALESLLKVLETCDFGMFVFSPDDIVTIRGEKNSAVRDNVIFELGLFVGALGRERCFILVPDGTHDLRIPTDLIGMTPATFETNRSDGSIQAATAPACHTIRTAIERIGLRSGHIEAPKQGPKSQDASDEEESQPEPSAAARKKSAQDDQPGALEWLDAMVKDDYARAAELLTKQLVATDDEEERAMLESWLGRTKYSINPKEGTQYLSNLTEKYPKSEHPYVHLVYAHLGRDLFSDALEAAERGLQNVGHKPALVQAKVRCLSEMGREEEVERTLRQAIIEMPDTPDLYLTLAEHYADTGHDDEARSILEQAEQQLPDNESILARYARQLEKLPDKKLALIPYARLMRLKPADPTYRTLRANIFLELDLNDLAMRDYKKANELAGSQQGWILGNIGNLLKNRGFYRDGIEYLTRAIEQEPESEYAHERLAVAIKLRDDEEKKLQEILKEARKELVAFKLKAVEIQAAAGEHRGEGTA
jgi:tetratricopeptide (TPR) repeat protein